MTYTAQPVISAGLEIGGTGSIAWFGPGLSVGIAWSPGWTFHMGKEPSMSWDWVLWTIPGYDSSVKRTPNPHSDEPGHNCGCQ